MREKIKSDDQRTALQRVFEASPGDFGERCKAAEAASVVHGGAGMSAGLVEKWALRYFWSLTSTGSMPAAPAKAVTANAAADRLSGVRKLKPKASDDQFAQHLLGAFQALGLDADLDHDGSVVCVCPSCQGKTGKQVRLVITEGLATCTVCDWSQGGKAGEIAAAGVAVRGVVGSEVIAPGHGLSILAEADALMIRQFPEPEDDQPVLYLNSQPVALPGDVLVLAAQAKSGKTASLGGALTALIIGPQDHLPLMERVDTLGWDACDIEGKAIVVIDTEQRVKKAWQLTKRTMDRAELREWPKNVRVFPIRSMGWQKRQEFLELELERASLAHGGVGIIVLDGVADLVRDPNDQIECSEYVEKLMALAERYACPLCVVIHENVSTLKQQGPAKTRGHLGSMLERKAGSNLRLKLNSDGVSIIWGYQLRDGAMPESKGWCFAWSDLHQRHMSVDNPKDKGNKAAVVADKLRQSQTPALDAVFAGLSVPASYTDLREKIGATCGGSVRTQERRITAWIEAGFITSQPSGGYVRA